MNRSDNILNICNYKNQVKKVLMSFYESYYSADRLKLYSYLDTSFQREVPLNYFLINPNYIKELGVLEDITGILIEKENNMAFLECVIKINNKSRDIVITMKSDFGGWKITGESIFYSNF